MSFSLSVFKNIYTVIVMSNIEKVSESLIEENRK